jgi:RNA polymerase sigma-70 factor, ECF subfamily
VTRRNYRKQKWLKYFDQPPEEESLPARAGAGLDAGTTANAMVKALNSLSYDHREAVVLRFYEEKSVKEIAEQVGSSEGTIKSRLHYALERLRELVPEELNDFAPQDTYR